MIDNLKKIKITAASGENHFVMDRGCFTYDQETTNPEVLSFIGTNDTTSGFESRYEAGDEKFVIKAEHRNRHIGPTLEFGCKATPEVTIFRVGRSPKGKFRFFIAQGEAMDQPKQFFGTSLSVRTEGSAEKIVDTTVREGWEPHYAVIYGNCADSLEILGHMLDLEVERF